MHSSFRLDAFKLSSRAYSFFSDDIWSDELVLDVTSWVLVFDTPNAVLVDCVFISAGGLAAGGLAAAG